MLYPTSMNWEEWLSVKVSWALIWELGPAVSHRGLTIHISLHQVHNISSSFAIFYNYTFATNTKWPKLLFLLLFLVRLMIRHLTMNFMCPLRPSFNTYGSTLQICFPISDYLKPQLKMLTSEFLSIAIS